MEHPTTLVDVEYLPLDDAVKEYAVPKTTLWRHFKRGLVEGMKVAGRIHLRRTSLDALLLSGASSTRSTTSRPPWNATWTGELRAEPSAAEPSAANRDMHSQDPDGLQHSIPGGTPYSAPSEMPYSIPRHSARGTEAEQPFPRRSTSPGGTVREIHDLAVRLDDLHRELRRTERDNDGLRFELQRYRTALEENAASILEREARARHAETLLVQRDNELTNRLEQEVRARQETEAQLEALHQARETASAHLQATQAELQQALEAAAELEALRHDREAAAAQLQATQAELHQAQEAAAELEALRHDRDSAAAQLQAAQAALQQAQEAAAELEALRHDREGAAAQLQATQAELQQAQQAAAELEALRQEREAAAAQLQAAQAELQQAHEAALRAAEEARSASHELTTLQARHDEEAAATREQAELSAWRAEQATAQADSAQSTIAALRELLEAEKAQPWWRRLFKR